MVVYIEYAFLQNFLFDGVLLLLAFLTSGAKIKFGRIVFSAFVGSIFALIFPFLRLPNFLLYILKISVGGLLCLLASEPLKNRKAWGRYASTSVFFYLFTFGFGGAISVFFERLPKKFPLFWAGIVLAVLTGISLWLIGKFRQKKALYSWLYACEVIYKDKKIRAQGFLDSGNLASKNGIPVCFLSTHLFYELWGEEFAFADGTEKAKDRGQGWDKMEINTLTGVKEIPLRLGILSLKNREKRVYFAPSKNMITREYNLLLNARVLED